MQARHSILAFSLALAVLGVACADRTPVLVQDEPEVRTIVTRAGYADPAVVVREGDLWRVQSADDHDAEVTLFVNERGEVLGASDVARERISSRTTTTVTTNEPAGLTQPAAVEAVIRDAGFHDVQDIAFSDRSGVWIAEADDITGDDFEIHVDPDTGLIVHIEDD
jgi:hypothetical protein